MIKQADIFEIKGIGDVQKVLDDIAPKQARNLNRAVVSGIARELAKRIKAKTPIDTGNLKKSIKTKNRRSAPDNPRTDIYFQHGKDVKNDGFYWRFVEHGTSANLAKGHKATAPKPFVGPVRDQFKGAKFEALVKEQLLKKLAAAAKRELKRRRS